MYTTKQHIYMYRHTLRIRTICSIYIVVGTNNNTLGGSTSSTGATSELVQYIKLTHQFRKFPVYRFLAT